MTFNEYYNFSEDANVSLKYSSFFDEQPDNFPCPSNMSDAFSDQTRYCIKMLNTSNVTDMSSMFESCTNLTSIPLLDTSNVTNMSSMFESCTNLTSIPLLDTSNVTNMESMFEYCTNLTTIPLLNTSNVTNMSNMFNDCTNLTSIPQLDTSNVTDMSYMFYVFSGNNAKLKYLPPLNCNKVTSMGRYFGHSSYPRTILTDVGGWLNLKCNWDDGYGLNTCSNLTYESCINILNGLYNFVENNETPSSSQGKLKVHQNFIDLVGDEISIAVAKNWVVSV